MINITVNGITKQYEAGVTVEHIVKDLFPNRIILLCAVNHKLHGLFHRIYNDSVLIPFDNSTTEGRRIYQKTALFILMKAIHDIYPVIPLANIIVRFNIGNGLFIQIKNTDISDEMVANIKKRMLDIVHSDITIKKNQLGLDYAISLLEKVGMFDKIKLLKYRKSSNVTLYSIDNFVNYCFDFVGTNSSCITSFDLIKYESGIVLTTPTILNPNDTEPFTCSSKLFDVLFDYSTLMESSDLGLISEFNDHLSKDGFISPILLQEALMDDKISDIAKKIASNDNIKIVLIAGPSSSGKTTFSHRLSVQLKVNGLISHPLETDNYFKGSELTPLGEDGKPDYECLEAMDVDGFVSDCINLLSGNAVSLPKYNFTTGKREYHGATLQLSDRDILLAEGIHCLDPKMIGDIPEENIFRIYIAPLSQINLDNTNSIYPEDVRLIRRIIRDNRGRGNSASKTIAQWASVRRGEEKYVLPFIDTADAIFNSSMIYELGVLKPYVEVLLYGINKDDPSYATATRLLKLLDYVLSVPSNLIPTNSLLSEFVGGNIFGV